MSLDAVGAGSRPPKRKGPYWGIVIGVALFCAGAATGYWFGLMASFANGVRADAQRMKESMEAGARDFVHVESMHDAESSPR
jgi:hypothetical protein